jgi:predicted transcriptional regulator
LRVLDDNQTGYWPDYAAEIDREEETLADELGVSLEQARAFLRIRDAACRHEMAMVLGQVLGILIAAKNLPVMVHSLALAAGLDQLNGAHSEAEVARELGVTRALVSHYVVGWRDVLSGGSGRGFDITKFRKRNETRETYAEQATDPFLEAKRRVLAKIREHNAKLKK